jgi:cytochrome b pre-mRNA-processing protein 3
MVKPPLRSHKRLNPGAPDASALYSVCVGRARAPIFYTRLEVPDTIDGRFDLVTLHASLVLEALNDSGLDEELGTPFVTLVFAGFEEALRELGVGDFGMARRIKAMADAFYGRLDAYARAMQDEDALRAALLRNVYRGDEARESAAGELARYAIAAGANASLSLKEGALDFGPLPGS